MMVFKGKGRNYYHTESLDTFVKFLRLKKKGAKITELAGPFFREKTFGKPAYMSVKRIVYPNGRRKYVGMAHNFFDKVSHEITHMRLHIIHDRRGIRLRPRSLLAWTEELMMESIEEGLRHPVFKEIGLRFRLETIQAMKKKDLQKAMIAFISKKENQGIIRKLNQIDLSVNDSSALEVPIGKRTEARELLIEAIQRIENEVRQQRAREARK